MIKRFAYAAALAGVSLLSMGCNWGWGGGSFLGAFYNTNVSSMTRVLAAYLREDLFG